MTGIIKYPVLFMVVLIGLFSPSCKDNTDRKKDLGETEILPRVDTFMFSSNGTEKEGKIYLPASYGTNKNLPAIFLIDYTEQHFRLATDEFEKVIDGVNQIEGFEALVVTLNGIPDIDAKPVTFLNDYQVYKSLAFYVDGKYTKNSSRTFIGKGSESGVVLNALLVEDSDSVQVFDNFIATDPSGIYTTTIINMLESNDFPAGKEKKKLHFSFSTSNDAVKCNKLIKVITDAGYPWLEFETVEYKDSNYENTYPISYPAGLKFVFDK